MKNSKYFEFSQEVKNAMESGRAIVALETAVLTHEMPYPQNVQTAKQAEAMIRSEGAIPAAIAVIRGKIKIGLTAQETEYFGKEGMKIFRASVKDIAEAAAKGMDASLTASAAMAVAQAAGIRVFSTGGIGGVHRGAETTMDMSADLPVLGKNCMVAVCSGPKSFLDAELTKEKLETLGVPVIGYGTDEMPGFYYRESGIKADFRMDSPDEIAAALKIREDLSVTGSILVTSPVPQNMAMSKPAADMAIEKAVKAAESNGIKGKELTPFLVALIKEMTGGMSLDAYIALYLSNANLAAKTAVRYAGLDSEKEESEQERMDMLRAEIADDTAECIGKEISALRSEMENTINQKIASMPAQMPYMNPYMNPYQQMPYQQMQNPYQAPAQPVAQAYQQMPYQQMPNPYQMPVQPMQQVQPQMQPQVQQPAPYVNPYKPVRTEPVEPVKEEPVVQPPHYEPIPDDKWVNPFAPKRENREQTVPSEEKEDEQNMIARPADEVMKMVEESVAESEEKESEAEAVYEEPGTIADEAEAVEETVQEEVSGNIQEEPAEAAIEESAAAQIPAEPEEDEGTLTEYVPPVHEKKERKPDNQVKQETDGEGMTAYDPEFYKKRAAERKARIAEAAGEAKHVEEAKAAEPEYIDCKGPLEFTGEHPWAWKCTRCGQVFQKHEIPHKCIKTE